MTFGLMLLGFALVALHLVDRAKQWKYKAEALYCILEEVEDLPDYASNYSVGVKWRASERKNWALRDDDGKLVWK